MFGKKGFTLIEMLIVVAIIGILAGAVLVGLGPVQKGGRDARRLSDLRQVQNGLELYFNKNGTYPASGASLLLSEVAATIQGATGGQIPVDPRNVSPFLYYYSQLNSGSSYILGAALEDVSNKSAQSGSFSGSGTFASTNCNTTSSANGGFFMYCISL